ncbi:hypothetical protein N7453_008615 [Penicillium expansum]|nr:hypothetical protein N7453_008615 [Penicillium expansum]
MASQELKSQEGEPRTPDIIMTTTPRHDETDQIYQSPNQRHPTLNQNKQKKKKNHSTISAV